MAVLHGDLLLRRSGRTHPRGRTHRRVMITLTIVSVAMVTPLALGGLLPSALIIGCIAPGGLALGYRYLYSSRIIVTAQDITVVGTLTRRRRPRTAVVSAVRVLFPGRAGMYENLFLRSAGRPRHADRRNERPDIDQLFAHLGVPITGLDHVVTPNQFNRAHPGLVPWVERRPMTAGVTSTWHCSSSSGSLPA